MLGSTFFSLVERITGLQLEIVRGSLVAFATRIFGVLLGFAVSVVVARLFGASGAGTYFLFLAFVLTGSTVARFGLDDIVVREISGRSALGKFSDVFHVSRFAIKFVFVTSSAVAAIMFFSAEWLANELLDKPVMKMPIMLSAACVLPFSVGIIFAENLRGLKRIFASEVIKLVGVPAIALTMLYPAYHLFGAPAALLSYTIAVITVALGSALIWRMVWRDTCHALVLKPHGGILDRVIQASWPLFGVALTGLVMQRAGTFFVAALGSMEEVGVFSVALRVSGILLAPLVAVTVVLAPRFSEMFSRGEMLGIRELSQRSSRILASIAIPSVIVIGLNSELIMSIFGPEFNGKNEILNALLVGVLVNAATGPVGYLLTMCGHEYIVRNINIVAAFATIIACFFLVPVFQGLGGAMAVSAGLVFKNTVMVFMVRAKLGFNVFGALAK